MRPLAAKTHGPTRLFLRVFVVSITVTALVGIFAIAKPGDIGWFEAKVLLTTLIIAAASICGLACGGCLTRGRTILPIAGLVLTVLAAYLLLMGIWFEFDWGFYWKLTLSVSFFAVACAHLSMLFLANLAGIYRWAYLAAYQLILGLATLLAAGVVFEVLFDNDSYIRFIGVVSVLVAAITLLIPVFHYLSRDVVAAAKAEADPLFALEEEIARLKKRLIELESRRRAMLGREKIGAERAVETFGADDGPSH